MLIVYCLLLGQWSVCLLHKCIAGAILIQIKAVSFASDDSTFKGDDNNVAR